MRRWLERFFRDGGEDDARYEQYEPEEDEAYEEEPRPSRPVTLEPPVIRVRPAAPEEEPLRSEEGLEAPPLASRESAPAYEAPAERPAERPPVPAYEPPAYEPPAPSAVRAVAEWAGREVADLLNELPPAARERAAEALTLWHDTEAQLSQSLRRADGIAEQTDRLTSSALADTEFAADTNALRSGTEMQRTALRALLEGNRARAREWVLAAIHGLRQWSPAKAIRLFQLAGIGPLTLADLQPRLRGMEAGPRMWVAEALGEMAEPEAAQALLGLLRDPDADVRATAVAALGRKSDPALLHALGTVIKRDPDWLVRLRAIQAAEGFEGYEAIGFLHELLRDTAWWRELQVLDSIERAAPVAPSGAPEAAPAAGTHDKVRAGVVNALLAKVQAALPSADAAHRAWLMEVLGDSGDARAVPLLSAALHDSDLEVRTRALRGLGRLGGPAIVDLITPALKDQQPEVRIQAAEALGDANDFRAMEPLLEAMRDADELVRAAAAAAIGKIWDRRALGPMMDALAALNDPDQKTREEFQRAMQRMSDPRTMNLLMGMLEAGGLRTRRPGT